MDSMLDSREGFGFDYCPSDEDWAAFFEWRDSVESREFCDHVNALFMEAALEVIPV